MSSRRLNAIEKQEIVDLYRQPGETSITLAERFGVSNSTIGRVLKSGMSVQEYDSLVQQKRGRGHEVLLEEDEVVDVVEVTTEELEQIMSRKPRKRILPAKNPPLQNVLPQSAVEEDEDDFEAENFEPENFEAESFEDEDFDDDDDIAADSGIVPDAQFLEVAAELGSVVARRIDEDDLEDDLEEGLDEDFDEDDDLEDVESLPGFQIEASGQLTILPLMESVMPRICYLVVDRGAELIAPPLRDFADLGNMSQDTANTKTLPVFDNHRVAKRFSNIRTQRVIKVPDSRVFSKVARHLQAKGIKHLLVDGQVYSLN